MKEDTQATIRCVTEVLTTIKSCNICIGKDKCPISGVCKQIKSLDMDHYNIRNLYVMIADKYKEHADDKKGVPGICQMTPEQYEEWKEKIVVDKWSREAEAATRAKINEVIQKETEARGELVNEDNVKHGKSITQYLNETKATDEKTFVIDQDGFIK